MGLHKNVAENNLHEPKGVSVAARGRVYVADGLGSGAWSNQGGNSIVVVNSILDLPTAAGGKHTLAANTDYELGANIDIAGNYLQFGAGSGFSGPGAFINSLTYTGAGAVFRGDGVNATIKDITVIAGTGDVYDFTDSGAGNTFIVLISDVLVISCGTAGTFSKLRTVVMDGSTVVACQQGLVFGGTTQSSIRLNSIALSSTNTSYVGIDFTGSLQQTVNMEGVLFKGGAGSIGLKGDAGSANIAVGYLANISNCQFNDVTTPLSGITTDDIRLNFKSNGVVKDSMPDAMVSMVANATATVITTIATPVKVLGTWVVQRASQYTCTTAGRATYNGERPITTPIDATLTLSPASGTNKVIRVKLALNGTPITASGKAIKVDTGSPQTITVPWQLEMTTTDYIEVFVENETDTVDVLVQDAVLRIR